MLKSSHFHSYKFYRSPNQCIQAIHFISKCIRWESNHWPCHCQRLLYHLNSRCNINVKISCLVLQFKSTYVGPESTHRIKQWWIFDRRKPRPSDINKVGLHEKLPMLHRCPELWALFSGGKLQRNAWRMKIFTALRRT